MLVYCELLLITSCALNFENETELFKTYADFGKKSLFYLKMKTYARKKSCILD